MSDFPKLTRVFVSGPPDLARTIVRILNESGELKAELAEGPSVWSADVSVLPSGPKDPILASLNDRELEVLRHVAAGLHNDEVADVTGIAAKTVKNYMAAVLGKMGMKGRRVRAAVYFALSQQAQTGPPSGPDSATVDDR